MHAEKNVERLFDLGRRKNIARRMRVESA